MSMVYVNKERMATVKERKRKEIMVLALLKSDCDDYSLERKKSQQKAKTRRFVEMWERAGIATGVDT